MRIANATHESRPWVIAGIAPDFELLDVWALPVEGGPDGFDDLLEVIASFDAADASMPTRLLFAVRHVLGRLLRWDAPTGGARVIPGRAESTLAARLPGHLVGTATGPRISALQGAATFVPLFRTTDEWAAELSNQTMHGVLQLTWIHEGADRYRGRLAVYVKARGRLGRAYLAFIGPFRHLVVYPALMRQLERAWRTRNGSSIRH